MTLMEAHELKTTYPNELANYSVFDVELKWSKYSQSKGFEWLIPSIVSIRKVFGDA